MRRLLIVGCGDVAQRALPWLIRRFRVFALVRHPQQVAAIRAQGAIPILGDLDRPSSLTRLSDIADCLLHCAPPPTLGVGDLRTAHLLAALAAGGSVPRRIVYISTSGVYGDCGGKLIAETQPLAPTSARAERRVAAEKLLKAFAQRHGSQLAVLRAPGIYAANRLPLERVRASTPVIEHAEDSYSNHIHADDLAHACGLALFFGLNQRAYHICDNASWRMGEWFDYVADAYGLPRPPRLPRQKVEQSVSPQLWSFMRESRRLENGRMKTELGVRLAYPTPLALLSTINSHAETSS